MFKQMQVFLMGFTVLLALTGCGGSDDVTERIVVFGPAAQQSQHAQPAAAHAQPSPLRSDASEGQRLAEEARLIAFEQSFSREMNSQHEENQQRATQHEQQRAADIASASMDSATTVQ